MAPKFKLGCVVATPGALIAFTEAKDSIRTYLARHASGDWGEVSSEDAGENELSLLSGLRLLSAYQIKDGARIWIITEADRSATTILLPEEY
jgi:hypothetical protein